MRFKASKAVRGSVYVSTVLFKPSCKWLIPVHLTPYLFNLAPFVERLRGCAILQERKAARIPSVGESLS